METYFCCNLEACKGACCTLESEYGAPLKEEELTEIENVLDVVLPMLPERNRESIKKDGFFEQKSGELLTRSIDNKDCVFVYYDNDIAKCAIEKAFFEGKIDFRKPISCHLFPIRISQFGGDIVRYEKFFECVPALKLGEEKQITVAEFCKDSLERLYGKEWYKSLTELKGKSNVKS